jgi:hypothetical protein
MIHHFRAAFRDYYAPNYVAGYFGFRLVARVVPGG